MYRQDNGGEKAYDAFLCHNSQDKPIVLELAERLRARNLRVWLDQSELRPGAPWQDGLEKGLCESKAVLVLCGPHGDSPWAQEERRVALSQAVGGDRFVIPVLLPGLGVAPQLPEFFSQRTWVDMRTGFSDASMDALVWGITGVKPGLRRDDERASGVSGTAPTRSHESESYGEGGWFSMSSKLPDGFRRRLRRVPGGVRYVMALCCAAVAIAAVRGTGINLFVSLWLGMASSLWALVLVLPDFELDDGFGGVTIALLAAMVVMVPSVLFYDASTSVEVFLAVMAVVLAVVLRIAAAVSSRVRIGGIKNLAAGSCLASCTTAFLTGASSLLIQ